MLQNSLVCVWKRLRKFTLFDFLEPTVNEILLRGFYTKRDFRSTLDDF